MSTYIKVSWGYRRQCKKVKTFCTTCKKTIHRVVERGYYDNGFHDARKTSAKNWEEIEVEAKKLAKSGDVCKTCQDIADGIPTFKRIEDGLECKGTEFEKKCKRWEILSREKTPKRLGIVREYDGGWAKFLITYPKAKSIYKYHRSIRDAASEIVKHSK